MSNFLILKYKFIKIKATKTYMVKVPEQKEKEILISWPSIDYSLNVSTKNILTDVNDENLNYNYLFSFS